MERMKAYARTIPTPVLIDAIMLLGGGRLDTDHNMARAALLDVYAERMGDEECDALMDLLGM
jgi:hypothetical protein